MKNENYDLAKNIISTFPVGADVNQVSEALIRAMDALDAIKDFALVRNDRDAFLYTMAVFGLGIFNPKAPPKPEDYGL